jgi:hypothetical protein
MITFEWGRTPRLEVPYYMLDGQAELTARRDLALEWYAQLEAPIKRVFSFEDAAHSVSMEQFEAFHGLLLEVIVPETYPPAMEGARGEPAGSPQEARGERVAGAA